jgi:hypothetical protein
MSKLLEWAITAAIGVVVPALLFAIWRAVTWLLSMKATIDAMREGGKARTEETQTIVSAILALSDTQRATLEAVRDGKANGNITWAIGKLDDTDDKIEAMLVKKVG